MTGSILYLHALTPIHCGTGQAVGVIDLPISREKATGWPQIPGSSLKGVLRDGRTDDDSNALYGTQEKAGGLAFGDQRILFLAVRSYYGTFAYVTCPLALLRLRRDAEALGVQPPSGGEIPFPFSVPDESRAAIAADSVLVSEDRIYLEDLDLRPAGSRLGELDSFAETLLPDEAQATAFRKRVAVVPDDTFSFLCETATEVTARVRLNEDTKTVASGGLWYEEAVPAESIFAGVVVSTRPAVAIPDLNGKLLQVGGDATTGRGLCRLILQGGGGA